MPEQAGRESDGGSQSVQVRNGNGRRIANIAQSSAGGCHLFSKADFPFEP
jgi:hypothetical protein